MPAKASATNPVGTALRRFFIFFLLILLVPGLRAQGSTVHVPLSFEYPLLEQLLVRQLFNTPDGSAEILNDRTGCSRIDLSDPRLGPAGEELTVIARVKARLGAGVPGACSELLTWQGQVGFTGRPVIGSDGTSLRFEPRESWLIDPDGKEIRSGALREVADASLKGFFGRFTLDLAPYLRSLGDVLPDFLPHRSTEQLQSIVAGLGFSALRVSPESLDVSMDFPIEAVPQPPLKPEGTLSPEEMQRWEERWQLMDALLALAVKYYASATDLQALRSALLEILIDSRYRLGEALAEPVSPSHDPVRAWFLDSWQRLDPVIRRIALEQEGQEHLLVFNVLAAGDALQALDQLGPGIGLDISADGLRRLARLIDARYGEELLRYSEEVDPELQRLFQEQFETEAPEPEMPEPAALRLDFSLFPRAWAATSTDRLANWAPRRDDLDDYLPLVSQLLQTTSEEVSRKHRLAAEHKALFRNMVFATAWQESCWRQFVVKDKKLVPLRSGTGDVGLMQINERVWRGFYDLQKLRWDIGYNSGAGAEVLLDYLLKYALRQGEHKRSGGRSNLARASYSAYNGGPGQVSRYRRKDVPAAHRKIDAAFWDKYQQVAAGNELRVAVCLGGEPPSPGAAAVKPAAKKPAGSQVAKKPAPPPRGTSPATTSGEQWVRAQRAEHFTLQLGAFSKAEFAADFIRQESLSGPVHVHPVRQGGETRYLVLYGSYGQRGDAESAKRKFTRFKPWLRRFGELQGR